MTGLDEHGPPPGESSRHRRERGRQHNEEEDAEYKLALEASKFQEEEDRRHRESRHGRDDDDDDLAKAIKLSKEEEDRRRRELEESNASSLFDDDLIQTAQPQYTGFNQGYQQGNAVDFFANPIDQNQMQAQPTGYLGNAYTGFQTQPTGFQAQPTGFQSYPNGFGTQPNGFDPYGQQNGQQQQQAFQPQSIGYNPYGQAQSPVSLEPSLAPGSNNPWATNNQQQQSVKLTPTGSNNPFASSSPFGRPQAARAPTLGSLPEQKTLSSFSQPSTGFSPPPMQQQQQQPGREMNEHEAKLNALLAGGDGQDTFGNTGQLRIPAQHTAPGTFVNSAGAGLSRLTADAPGSNPFLRTQFTGMPNVSYGGAGLGAAGQIPAATGPAGMNGFGMGGAQGNNNPFGRQQAPQYSSQGDLIQF